MQDYDAEQQQYLEEQRFYDEKGELNEELLARPEGEIRPEDYADAEMKEDALFVPVSSHEPWMMEQCMSWRPAHQQASIQAVS